MEKLWRPIALGRLGELRKRAAEIKDVKDILSAVEIIEMPEDLKKKILAMPINTKEETISRMIEKVRDYEEV